MSFISGILSSICIMVVLAIMVFMWYGDKQPHREMISAYLGMLCVKTLGVLVDIIKLTASFTCVAAI